jgi:hypothetical protein
MIRKNERKFKMSVYKTDEHGFMKKQDEKPREKYGYHLEEGEGLGFPPQVWVFHKKIALEEALADILQLRAEIRDEVLKVETDIKNGGSKDFLTAVHKKKTYQSMGLTFAAEIIQKRIDAL